MNWFTQFRLWLAGYPRSEPCCSQPCHEQNCMKIGTAFRVPNRHAKNNAASFYYAVMMKDHTDGDTGIFLFTQKQMEDAKARAIKNPEDIPMALRIYCDNDGQGNA